jgi:hypothetical protein
MKTILLIIIGITVISLLPVRQQAVAAENGVTYTIQNGDLVFRSTLPSLIGISVHLDIPSDNAVLEITHAPESLAMHKVENNTFVVGISSKNRAPLDASPLKITFEQPLKKAPVIRKLRYFTDDGTGIAVHDYSQSSPLLFWLRIVFVVLGVPCLGFAVYYRKNLLTSARRILDSIRARLDKLFSR